MFVIIIIIIIIIVVVVVVVVVEVYSRVTFVVFCFASGQVNARRGQSGWCCSGPHVQRVYEGWWRYVGWWRCSRPHARRVYDA